MASNVPRFASFRPKPKETPQPVKPPEIANSEKRETSERRDRAQRPDKNPRDKVSKRLDVHGSHAAEKERTTSYFVDRNGDRAIVTYGSLNRYETPSYRRYGYGTILGLAAGLKIDPEQSTDRDIVVSVPASRRRERLLASKHAITDATRRLRFVKATKDSQTHNGEDFIYFSAKGKRKRDTEVESNVDDYRSLEAPSARKSPSDSDLASDSDSGKDESNIEITEKNSRLIQMTRDQPHNLEAWLELVDHQEAMMLVGRTSYELNNTDRKNLADVRLSTYEQAIRKVGDDKESQIKLLLGLMAEASKSWDEGRLMKKWSDILSQYPSSCELWIRYLDFVQGGFSSFKYEQSRVSFHQCLNALKSSKVAVPAEVFLHILVRLTCLIRGAGYQELALAIWQAIIEFHMMPPEATTGTGSRLALFEEFWDSEVPRVGEANAKGWRNTNIDDVTPPSPFPASLQPLSQPLSVFDDFKVREVDYMERFRYPGRTTDEDGEDDPFHLVLFSDIEGYLPIVPEETPHKLLIDAFLCFSGMPPLPQLGTNRHSWRSDPFLRHETYRNDTSPQKSDAFGETLKRLMECSGSFEMTPELLSVYGFPTAAGHGSGKPTEASSSTLELEFLRRTLRLMATDFDCGEEVGEYLLAFEAKYFTSEAHKTAKQLLKARSTSLSLYNSYGSLESSKGNSNKADQVLSTALSMQNGDVPLSTTGSLRLFTSWVWEALHRGDQAETLRRLVSPQGNPSKWSDDLCAEPNQAALLRGRTVLNEAKERALLRQGYTSAVLATKNLVILAYLSSGQNLGQALLIHDELSEWFLRHGMSRSPAAELHAQSGAQFLQYHATTAPIVKPALLRDALEPLIARFSTNTLLLSIYAANEARFSIDDRVRGIMHQRVLRNPSTSNIAGWFFAIRYEMHKGEIAGSTSHSIRALFKKAEDDVGAHCPALWKSHLLFELDQAQAERAKRPPKKPRRDGKKSKDETRLEESYRRVRETFFQGMTRLPWCKDYMMLAYTHMQHILTHEDLAKVYNVMVEKELRIHVDMNVDVST